MRTRAAAIAIVVAAALAAGVALASAAETRVSAAAARMDRLTSLRLELDATVTATGAGAPGGSFTSRTQARGELVMPDRLRLVVSDAGRERTLLIVGDRVWVDEGGSLRPSVARATGPLRDPRSTLLFIRGPGAVRFAGLGMLGGVPTYRARIELGPGDLAARLRDSAAVSADARGATLLEIGLFDDLIRKQVFEVRESADGGGSGLTSVRTTYTVTYSDFDAGFEVREPD